MLGALHFEQQNVALFSFGIPKNKKLRCCVEVKAQAMLSQSKTTPFAGYEVFMCLGGSELRRA
jgi:hypothetical protein